MLSNKRSELRTKCLDEHVNIRKVKRVMMKLKVRKASRLDQISNEMLKHGFRFIKEAIGKLFNFIISSVCIPPPWALDIISPIYKSDDKLDPGNYIYDKLDPDNYKNDKLDPGINYIYDKLCNDRGICVINCLSKLFLLILNERLTDFISSNNLLW